ncbi:MAG: hypothetical protein M1822_002619 [Bathelium mastoideum]|nr:MAG: hypothetical protein M1822_002619 [Bathelium mastoideum]
MFETGQYYNFSNIAYAQPPVGALRFSSPLPPQVNRVVLDGGSSPRMCPQGTPSWLSEVLHNTSVVPRSPSESEDCLYLDVHVPKKVFSRSHGADAPVLVWIHGGGEVIGSKTSSGDPAGLIARSLAKEGSEGIIFIAINYRLGAFGFLGGPAFNYSSGVPNAGLLDQRLALEWVQNHIQQFGGDPDRVTVIGESAGSASIAHHMIAAQNTSAELPFLSNDDQDRQFDDWLAKLNVTTLKDARGLDTAVLQAVNSELVHAAPLGHFYFGITRDGTYVRDTITRSFAQGKFDKKVRLMISYNLHEGTIFIPEPTSITESFNFTSYVQTWIPYLNSSELHHIAESLYPPPGPETPYNTTYTRVETFVADIYIKCKAYTFDRASNGQAWAYRFSVGPAYHTEDVAYTFYNGPSSGINGTVALAMQEHFVDFAITGDPNSRGSGSPNMPRYGSRGQILNLSNEGLEVMKDPEDNMRCEFWRQFGVV